MSFQTTRKAKQSQFHDSRSSAIEMLESRRLLSAALADLPGPDALEYQAPIVITEGGAYSGNWQSLDPNTAAVTIQTTEPVVLENSNIRSRGDCISIVDAGDVIIRNTSGYGLNPGVKGRYVGRFANADGFTNLRLEHNYLEGTAGIYVTGYHGSSPRQTVKALYNKALNIDGRASNGRGGWLSGSPNPDYYRQFFQIDAVSNIAGGEVAWNQVINEPGKSRVEENINIHATTATPASPFAIHDNYIQGAFPSDKADARTYTGGGIMVSDNGSAYIHAFDNQVVGTGAIGIAISSGHDNWFYRNRIISSGRAPDGSVMPYSNVGAYIWNYNAETTFANNGAHDNFIAWVSFGKGGKPFRNDYWIEDNTPAEWTNNTSGFDGAIIADSVEADEWTLWTSKLGDETPGVLA